MAILADIGEDWRDRNLVISNLPITHGTGAMHIKSKVRDA